ncbi:MAG: TlpA disulfide reductase family protein [Chloroflexi bacterium]|nr:TlpA disulfide reductase family protein [Chloroflexota bacterium]
MNIPKLTLKYFPLISFALLVSGAGWIAISSPDLSQFEQAQEAATVGFNAPDFTLNTMSGGTVTLSDLRGQAVLLNLWASWCLPCRAEMPAMQRVYERYRDQGFVVLAVNVTNQDQIGAARAFVEEMGVTYPIALDVDGEVSRLYNLQALPSSFFIDPQGVIQEVIIGGPMAEALLAIRAEQLLRSEN